MEKITGAQRQKLRALWFARTLHENKIRIQNGMPKMQKEEFEEAWEKVLREFKKADNVSIS